MANVREDVGHGKGAARRAGYGVGKKMRAEAGISSTFVLISM